MSPPDPVDPPPPAAPVESDSRPPSSWLERLRARRSDDERYRVADEIGRGGMGVVERVWDDELRRTLARKVLGLDPRGSAGGGELDSKALARFLEEAQITGQLDHPGVVPVHELGAKATGEPYFTMRLIRGRDLDQVFELAREGREGWTITRAVGALLKVCETMEFAHRKGVLHRDLKPGNVRVGDFGEVYVMDWGLARVLGRPDTRDIRIQKEVPPRSLVQSDRRRSAAEGSDAGAELYTMDGDVLGTPAYMSPEQARGEIETLDARADVYSIGAMLYHLLAGRPPYAPREGRVPQQLVLMALLDGPPRPLAELARGAPAELAAICGKAMARDREARYADVRGLGDDLRAYLETRVVRAHASGPVAELGKWVRRNRAFAAALVAGVLALAGGLGLALSEKARADESARLAQAEAREAQRERGNVLRLSAFQNLEDLRAEAEELWPVAPELTERCEDWLSRADALVAGLEPSPSGDDVGHRARLAELRARGTPLAGGEYAFEDDEDRWWHAQLVRLIDAVEAFRDEETGWIRGLAPEHGWGVARRLEGARTLRERSLESADARARWSATRAALADRDANPLYDGLDLRPQLGLLPLGRDPRSGLFEFAAVLTGAAPERDASGELGLGAESAVVLVLIPGGRFFMGAQAQNPNAPNFDPQARPTDGPVSEVALEPFFLAKHELTQAQWQRLTGANPSYFAPEGDVPTGEIGESNPVEQVSWFEADRALARVGLALPSDAQWEYAARAGTESVWSTGDEAASLGGFANLCDGDALAAGVPWRPAEEWLRDGFVVHAPVGSFEPNGFGLHDVHGNVFEWTADPLGSSGTDRRMRGGSFADPAVFARSGMRGHLTPDSKNYNTGLRAARAVD